jgi:predicted metal-dependent hydrolase
MFIHSGSEEISSLAARRRPLRRIQRLALSGRDRAKDRGIHRGAELTRFAHLLRPLSPAVKFAGLEPILLHVGERELPVILRRNPRARRLIVRLGRDGKCVTVTVPPRASRREALEFVERSQPWIRERLRQQVAKTMFRPGASFPLRGEMVRIEHAGRQRGTIKHENSLLLVPGDPAHIGRRVRDWLIKEAKRDLTEASLRYAEIMDAKFSRIGVRDQKSRWGSCSPNGNLSYSWRLILAPPYVLDYVAAHEVAHLRHMNHGLRFWRLVLKHCAHAQNAKRWLRVNAEDIHRYDP